MDKDDWRIRRLGVDDAVTRFDCGDEDLNEFLLADALDFYFKQGFAPLSKSVEGADTRPQPAWRHPAH